MTLPDGVDPEGVQASFDRGVLEVRIPKPQARKPRKVSISVGGDATPASGGAEPNTIEGSEAPNGAAPELAPNAA